MIYLGEELFSDINKWKSWQGVLEFANKIKIINRKINIKMRVRASIKKRSEDCKIVRRKGVLFVINKKNPRFKQRQG